MAKMGRPKGRKMTKRDVEIMPKTITGAELKEIRKALGLDAHQLGRALGYMGKPNTVEVQIRKYESGSREIPPWIARLVQMFNWYNVPDEWIVPAKRRK